MIYAVLILLIPFAVLAGIGFLIYLLVRKIQQTSTSAMDNDNSKLGNQSGKNAKSMSETLTIRVLIVGVIALVMLIPLMMMQGVADERNGLYRNVLHDIENTWGDGNYCKGLFL